MYLYQLTKKDGKWTGSYVFQSKDFAMELANQMNEDREKCGLPKDIEVKVVELR